MRPRHLSGSEPARGARDSQRPASGLLILLATVTVAALTLPDLPPDVCFDDPGDLQAAACHLGIAHPPGYAAYCAAGWAWTRIAPVSPPRAITLACWATALAALLLAGVLMQVVGVPPVIAASFVLLLAAHPNVHENLLLPEVYAPTAALLLLAVLCLHHYARHGRFAAVAVGALAIGLAAGSRTPALLMVCGLLPALWLAARRRAPRLRPAPTLAGAAALAALPMLASVAYLWARDAPQSAYNHHALLTEPQMRVPYEPADVRRRLVRSLTGVDVLTRADGTAAPGLSERTWWLARRVMPSGPLALAGVALLVLAGALRMGRAAPHTLLALSGVMAGCLALMWLIPMDGTAGDCMPALLAGGVLAARAVSPGSAAPGSLIGSQVVVLAAVVLLTAPVIANKPAAVSQADAAPFLRELDMATLPPDSVIVCTWFESTALRHARIATGRRDVEIVAVRPESMPPLLGRLLREQPQRPLLVCDPVDAPGLVTTPLRNVWVVSGGAPEPLGSE